MTNLYPNSLRGNTAVVVHLSLAYEMVTSKHRHKALWDQLLDRDIMLQRVLQR